MRKQGISVALLITAALALAGCTQGGTSMTAETTAAPTSTTVVEETTLPEIVRAVPAFDGDCSAAISDAQLATIFGEGTVLQSGDLASPVQELGDEAGRVAGVLSCVWGTATDAFAAYAVMSPLASIAPEIVENPRPAGCDDDGWGGTVCSVSMAVGASWLTLETVTQEELDQTLPVLGDALVSEHPQAGTRPEGTWAPPLCADLVEAAHVAFPAGTVFEGFPSDNNPTGAYVEAVAAFGSMTYCGLSDLGGEAARVYVFAGIDATVLDAALPAIEVPGADAAFGAEDGPQIAVVGPNAIVTTGASTATARTLLAALIPAQTLRPADATDEESE